jgi:hypothetical protein
MIENKENHYKPHLIEAKELGIDYVSYDDKDD